MACELAAPQTPATEISSAGEAEHDTQRGQQHQEQVNAETRDPAQTAEVVG